MPERRFKSPQSRSVMAILEQEGTDRHNLPAIRAEVPVTDGSIRRLAYEIMVPWGRVRQLVQGIGGTPEAVVATHWPGGLLDVTTSKNALRFIDRRLKDIANAR